MVNYLLHSVRVILICHHFDTQVALELIRTLEVFKRGSVTDAAIDLVEKSEEERNKVSKSSSGKKIPKKPIYDSLTRTITIGPSQQSEANFFL